jgi:hypothetical protein
MSVVLAAAVPGRAIIMSDSRITLAKGGHTVTRDELQKVFQLTDHLTVGFTGQVDVAYKLIGLLTEYCQSPLRKSKNSIYLLSHLPRAAKYFYDKLTEQLLIKPPVELVYAGVGLGRGWMLPRTEMERLLALHKHSSIAATPSWQEFMFTKSPLIRWPAPISLIAKHLFPQNAFQYGRGMALATSGSGAGAIEPILPEMHKVYLMQEKNMQIFILQKTMSDYCARQKIDSVGGMSQIVVTDENGVVPMSYSYGPAEKDGQQILAKQMLFENGGWVQLDKITGKRQPIQHFNPLLIMQDNNFEALADYLAE